MRLLDRALFPAAAIVVSLALPACKPVVTGCGESNGAADLPDSDFEESPTLWTLGPHSTIDETHSVCGGGRSLKVQLDHGLGSNEVTRSAYFEHIELDKEYELAFHYRYESCAAAGLNLQIGNYEKHLKFDGTDGNWGATSIVVKFSSEPAWIDVYPSREGAATDYEGSQYDNNLMWLDGFTIN